MNDDTFYGCMKKLESIGVLKYDYRANPKRYSTVEMTILDKYFQLYSNRKRDALKLGSYFMDFYSFLQQEGIIAKTVIETTPDGTPANTEPEPQPAEEEATTAPQEENIELFAAFEQELEIAAQSIGTPLVITDSERAALQQIVQTLTHNLTDKEEKSATVFGFLYRAKSNAAKNDFLKNKFYPSGILNFLAEFNATPTQNRKPTAATSTQNAPQQVKDEGGKVIGFMKEKQKIPFPFPNESEFRKKYNLKKNDKLREMYETFLNENGCFWSENRNTWAVVENHHEKISSKGKNWQRASNNQWKPI